MFEEYHQQCWWFQKALAMPSPAAAESLPLMREVARRSRDGGRETRREISLPQSFASQNPAPSSEGALAVCVTASAVVMIIQVECRGGYGILPYDILAY